MTINAGKANCSVIFALRFNPGTKSQFRTSENGGPSIPRLAEDIPGDGDRGNGDPEDAGLLEADLSQGIWVEPKLLAEFDRAKSAEGKVRYDFQGTARGPLTARGRAVGGRTIGENGRLMLSALAARSVRFEATDVADRQRFSAAGRTTRTRNDPEPRQGTWLAHSAGSRSREPMLGRTKQLSSCPSDRWL